MLFNKPLKLLIHLKVGLSLRLRLNGTELSCLGLLAGPCTLIYTQLLLL